MFILKELDLLHCSIIFTLLEFFNRFHINHKTSYWVDQQRINLILEGIIFRVAPNSTATISSDVNSLDDPKNMKIRPKYDYLLPKKATKIRLLCALKGD